MKISNYNWNWWFVLTLITIFIGMFITMVAKHDEEFLLSNILMSVGFISLIPCLYIGFKPAE